VIFEEAAFEDLPEILGLQHRAYRSEGERYEDCDLPPLTQTLEEIAEDFENQLILKAVENGEIIGTVRAYMRDDGTCYIGRLAVDPELQDSGIGSRLMEEIEGRFPQADRYELFTGNLSKKPLHIYGKMGYRVFRTREIRPGIELLYLEKPGRSGAK
jgi:ribosomal protein S18 acetylase RimI-like enzyme